MACGPASSPPRICLRFNERIQIDGTEIGDDAFARLKLQVEAAIAAVSKRLGEKFGAFEALFALACLHFQESGCDFAVFEAGIGGRYDPVRLVGAHETCVTSVDYEHVELLGNSLELIVSDKSDACAAGGTIVYGENCRGLRPHLVEYNRGRGCTPLFVRDDIRIDNEVTAASGQHFDFQFGYHDFRRLEVNLPGAFQFNNSAIAAALFLLWLQREQPRKAPDRVETAIRAGLRDTRWPGRLEIISQDPLTVIDVGHTPDGIRQSLASLLAIHGADDWILVTGRLARQEGGRNRRRAGALLRYDHLHGGPSQGSGRAKHRRRSRARQSRGEPPCRRLDRGGGAPGAGIGRARMREEFMSPAACSWRSNTQRPPVAAARKICSSSEHAAPRHSRNETAARRIASLAPLASRRANRLPLRSQ